MPIFMKIDTIDGESTVRGFEKSFEVTSYSWGIKTTVSGPNGGTPGKAAFGEFLISKSSTIGASKMMLALAKGQRIKNVVIAVTRATNGNQVVLQRYTLQNALITSLTETGDGDGAAMEDININFTKITWEVMVLDNSGKLLRTDVNNWDAVTNTGS